MKRKGFRVCSLNTSSMSYRELFVSPSAVFGGYQKTFEEADYLVIGVPFDVTSTYRTGARFGPSAIREASLNIETYSFRAGIDIEDLRIHDLGDLHVTSDVGCLLYTSDAADE